MIGVGAAAALCLAAQAQAQVSVRHGMLDLSSQHSEFISGEHLFILTGKVEALQGQNRLRADLVKVYTKTSARKGAGKSPGKSSGKSSGGQTDLGDIERIEAFGNVYMVTPTQVVRGDKAVYTAADDTTVVTGDVVLTQGESVGQGRRLVINRQTGRSTLDPADGERVRMVVVDDKADGAKE
jgi:lipopolysaccharide export system protein LptA